MTCRQERGVVRELAPGEDEGAAQSVASHGAILPDEAQIGRTPDDYRVPLHDD